MNLRTSFLLAVAAVAGVLALAGCGADAQAPQQQATPVSVAQVVERQVTEWDEYTGRLEAVESVEIRARVSGTVDQVAFEEGKEVKKGDLLFVIDPRPFRAEVARARAELERVRTQLQLARSDLARSEKLLSTQAISQEEYDTRVAGQRSSSAALRAAEAALEVAQLNLSYTRVASPIDGRVGKAEVTRGNLVSAGTGGAASLLTTVVSVHEMYAYFDASEQAYLRYAELARRGERPSGRENRNPMRMGLANEEGFPHEGYIDFVDNRVNPSTGTIRARAVFPNSDRFLTPGLFVRLQLVGSGQYQATLIHDRAVGTDQDRKFVLVVGPDNKLEYRQVTLGPMVEGLRVVREGLKSGERIVVNGLQRVRPGSLVQPNVVPMDSPSALIWPKKRALVAQAPAAATTPEPIHN
jgi:RND family efflux transporter MFP subunit